jgi:hypothetical protein
MWDEITVLGAVIGLAICGIFGLIAFRVSKWLFKSVSDPFRRLAFCSGFISLCAAPSLFGGSCIGVFVCPAWVIGGFLIFAKANEMRTGMGDTPWSTFLLFLIPTFFCWIIGIGIGSAWQKRKLRKLSSSSS